MSTPQRFPLTVQSAYADLLQRLQADSVVELGGTPVLREKGGRKYWYTVQRLADRTVERYLGPDTKEVQNRVAQARDTNADLKARERARRPLVRMCREAGLPDVDAQTGKVLRALERAGLFRLRGVLVGTHAFRCYPALLGVDIPEARAVTEDIDVAAFHPIAVALDDGPDPPLVKALQEIGPFIARPDLHNRPTSWQDRSSGTSVEVLTPNQGGERDEPLALPALGVYAKPLRFLDFLIHHPVPAAVLYRSGVLVSVPQPARYAVHKVIVAVRRAPASQVKARKDIEQAAALIRVLAEDRPDDLEEAVEEARARGPSWRRHLVDGCRRLPDAARAFIEDIGG